MNQYKKLAGQTAIYGFGSVVPKILNYIILTPFYTRVLQSVADYGTHSYLYSYSAFIIILLTFGMETTFFRYAKSKGLENVFSTSISFLFFNGIVFSLLLYFFDGSIANLIGIVRVDYLWYFIGIIFLDVLSAIPFATLRYLEKAKLFAILKITNISINISINLIYLWLIPLIRQKTGLQFSAIFDEANLLEYTFRANLIANFITCLFLFPYTGKFFNKLDISLLKEMLIYSTPIMISGLMGMINEVADKILLNFLLPKNVVAIEQIGIYSANYKIALLITIFNSMFRFALEPFFFKVSGSNSSKDKYATVSKYYLIIGLFILLGVLLYLDIFKYFISSRYHEGLNIVPIVLLANFLFGMYYTMSVWYKVTDKTYFSAIFAIVGACVTVILNIILVPIFGYMGAAIATLFCYFTMFCLTFYFGQKYYKINYEFGIMIKLAIFAAFIYFLSSYLNFHNLYIKLAFNTILMIGYTIFVVLTNNEIKSKIIKYGKR